MRKPPPIGHVPRPSGARVLVQDVVLKGQGRRRRFAGRFHRAKEEIDEAEDCSLCSLIELPKKLPGEMEHRGLLPREALRLGNGRRAVVRPDPPPGLIDGG